MLVISTGAGVSQESGIPTFRGKGGLWNNYRAEELATPQAFSANPELVWQFYLWRREIIAKAQPNEAHKIIAGLESRYPNNFYLITQNIDGLHQKAGSKKVVELHGNIWRVRCTKCASEYYEYDIKQTLPKCKSCKELLRPAVVWFGENLPADALERAFSLAQAAKIFVSVGTSGLVYPASQLPFVAKRNGAFLIEVNPDETPITAISDLAIRKRATEGMKEALKYITGARNI